MARKSNTRREQGSGTIRKRKNGTWEGRITIGKDPGTGKQIQKSIYGKTQAEVAEKVRAAVHELDEKTYVEPSRVTVKSWMADWLETYCVNLSDNTRYSYQKQIDCSINPAMGAIRLIDLKPEDIQKFVNNLAKRPDNPLSPKSIKNCYAVLNRALNQAVANGRIKKNPCEGTSLPKIVKPDIKPLTEKETADFLNVISGHHNELIFRVALFTGMRQAELMGLRWCDVDFGKGTIKVERQLMHGKTKGTGYYFAPLKTDNSARTITPAPQVMSWLADWKKQQRMLKRELGDKWESEPGFDDLVFTSETGKHLSHTTLTHEAGRFGDKIGHEGFLFHDLRHTYAVMAIRAGDDIKTISSNLGHATVSITLDVYAAFTVDMALASSRRMGMFMTKFGLKMVG